MPPADTEDNESSSNGEHVEEVASILRQAAAAAGQPLSYEKYQSWQAEQDGEYPSAEAIKDRLDADSWFEVVQQIELGVGFVDKEIETALKTAVEDLGEPLTQDAYTAWRNEQAHKYPSCRTIAHQLGDGHWRDALKTVGIRPSVDRRGGNWYLSDEIEAALKTAVEDLGEPLSRSDYDSWCAERGDALPTSRTIIRRLGDDGWKNALDTVGIDGPEHTNYRLRD